MGFGEELTPHPEAMMSKTVLIVEDNELNMKLFNDLLETRGCRVVQTRQGVEAMDLARKHRPDLILMDIQLPEVSGLQVTQWLKDDDELRAIPIIAVTAFAYYERRATKKERSRQGRLRSLSLQTDFSGEVFRDGRQLPRSPLNR